MSESQDKVTLLKEVAKDLGLKSADVSGGQGNSYFSLKWEDNGIDKHLHVPKEDFARLNRQELTEHIAWRITNGEAEETLR